MRGDSMFSMDPYDSDDEMGSSDHHHHPPHSHNNKADTRKSNKPIMEKRRRARINNCLNDLKGILLEAMRKDPARHSKLEKADILELTVRHLQNIQRNQLAVAMATDPTVLYRFKNGFSECASEVGRYLSKLEGVEEGMKSRVSSHLTACVGGLQQVNNSPNASMGNNRYGSDVPFMAFSSPPTGALVPPSNLTPPGDLNNNKETHQFLVHRPVPINPLSTSTNNTNAKLTPPTGFGSILTNTPPPPPITTILRPSTPTSPLALNLASSTTTTTPPNATVAAPLIPVDYSTTRPQHQVVGVKVERNISPPTTNSSSSVKDSMWRPW